MKKFLIFVIVINIGLLIYLLAIKEVPTYDYNLYSDMMLTEGDDPTVTIQNQTVNVNMYSILDELAKNYKGEVPINSVTDKISNLLNTGFKKLYDDTKNLSKTELASYLEKNSSDIVMQTGITNIDNFEKFIQKIQIYKDEINCEKAEIIEDSYENGSDYDLFKVELAYDNGQVLQFNVYLSNKDYIDTPLVIIV